jgi:hypothetical protein
MSDEEQVDVHTSFDQEKWDELVEFIEQFNDTRKSSKKFYSQKMFELARMKVEEFKEAEEEIDSII